MVYIPKRVFVSKSAYDYPRTLGMLNRMKKLNPKIEIINISNNTPLRPALSDKALYDYIKETIVLCTRSANYMEVFASPGNVSENLGVVGKLNFHCPLQCSFCYLDIAGQGTPWNRVYVDLENFYEQAVKERLAYKIFQTLWSILSFHQESALKKVPENFKDVCDKSIRNEVLKKKSKILNDNKAILYLKKNLKTFFNQMEIELTESQEALLSTHIPKYYNENSKLPLSINISEYSDIVGMDHITNILDELMQLVQKDKDFKIKLRTKAANIENFIKYDGKNQVKVTIGLNTDYIIKKYEEGTATLDERIAAVTALIQKGGYEVDIAIEPIIKYTGYEDDYRSLIQRVKKEIDLSKVSRIKIGTVRYKTRLMNFIKSTHPKSGLFSPAQKLVKPEKRDKRWRYSKEERIKIYKVIKDELKDVPTISLGLGSENPDIWDELQINKNKIHTDTVYQFTHVSTTNL